MNRFNPLLFCMILMLCGTLGPSRTAGADDDATDTRVADSAHEIHPLLIGMKVPEITGLTRTDGTPFNLNAAIAEKPTILIFYRGGW